MRIPLISAFLDNMAAENMANKFSSAVSFSREFTASGSLKGTPFSLLDGDVVAAANQKLFNRADLNTFSIVSGFIARYHADQMTSISAEQVTIAATSSSQNLARMLMATKNHHDLREMLKPQDVSAGVDRILNYDFSDRFAHTRLHMIESGTENDATLRDAYLSEVTEFCIKQINTSSEGSYDRVYKLVAESVSEGMRDELVNRLKPVVAEHASNLIGYGAFTHLVSMMESMEETALCDDISSGALRCVGENLKELKKNSEFARLLNASNKMLVPGSFSAAQVSAVGQALLDAGDVAGFDIYISGLKNVEEGSRHHLHQTHSVSSKTHNIKMIFNYETDGQLLYSESNGLSAMSLEQAAREWNTDRARDIFEQAASATESLAQGKSLTGWYGGNVIPDIVQKISETQIKSLKPENL